MVTRQPHDSFEKTDLLGQINLIDAAERNDVKRFVLVSMSGNLERDSKLHHAKRAVEDKLRESGISYTILRPSCFMEVWLSPALGFDAKSRKASIYGGGEKAISFISLFDVAEFAVRVAGSDKAANHTIELGGPEALTPNEVIAIFESERGSKFDVRHVPVETLREQHAAAAGEVEKAMAALALDYCDGDSIEMDDTLARFGVQLTSLRDFARKSR